MDHFRKERVVFFKASFLRKTHLSCIFFWGGEEYVLIQYHPLSIIIPQACGRTTPVFGCFLAGQWEVSGSSAIHVRQRTALVPPSANPVWGGCGGGEGVADLRISQSTILLMEEILHQLIWRQNIIEYPIFRTGRCGGGGVNLVQKSS